MKELHGKPWRDHLGGLPQLEAFYLALAFLPGEDLQPAVFVAQLLEVLPLDARTRKHLGDSDPGRLVIYRRLMRNNLRDVVEAQIPRASARLGGDFETLFRDFLNQWAPTSRFLRHVTVDFLDFWARDRPSNQPYLHELARLEATRIEVASALSVTDSCSVDLSLEVGLVFAESVRLLRFEHAVHLLPDDEEDRTVPERRPTFILAYRDGDSRVRYLSLSPLSFHVLDTLTRGKSLGQSVTQGAGEAGQALDGSCIAAISELLGELAERGVVRGTRSVDGQ